MVDRADHKPECFPDCRYLRNRELVLGIYLVLSAAVTAYGPHRETLELPSQSSLALLVWFSWAQSAEPLMFKGILFAVSRRAASYFAGANG